MHKIFLSASLLALATAAAAAPAKFPKQDPMVQILTKDGQLIEGKLHQRSFSFAVDGGAREIQPADLLTIQTGDPASPHEADRIKAGLGAVPERTGKHATKPRPS